MKSLMIIVGFLLIRVYSAPALEEKDKNDKLVVISDETALTQIDKAIKHLLKSFGLSKEEIFMSIFLQSANQTCMRDEYKSHNSYNLLDNIDEEENSGGSNSSNSKTNSETEVQVIQVFINILILCSPKTDPLLKFVFENFMTFNIFFKAFGNEFLMEEPGLNELACINKYAVDNKMVNETVYDYKLKLVGKNDRSRDYCDEMTEGYKLFSSKFKLRVSRGSERKCIFKVLNHAEKVIIRTLLMVQFDLSIEQKNAESEYFIKEVREVLEEALTCFTDPTKFLNYYGIAHMLNLHNYVSQ